MDSQKEVIPMIVHSPRGYPASYGWRGQMPDGTWRMFATETEYVEAFKEALKAS